MSLFAENPWPIVWVCLAGAAILVAAVKLTQQGKYLLWAASLILLALLLLAIDAVWVTDAERVETVVDALVAATRRSDPNAVLELVTDRVQVEDIGGGPFVAGPAARAFLNVGLKATQFDWLLASNVSVDVAPISRQAKVDLRIHAAGSVQGALVRWNFATNPGEGSDWSLGLEETSPGVWKINRITPLVLPGDARLASLGFSVN